VIVFYLQLPAKERRQILSRAASAVAPGGSFLLVTHDPDNLERGYGGPRDPAALYGAEEVVAQLEGFVIERAGPVSRPVETAAGAREAIDALVRARRVVEP